MKYLDKILDPELEALLERGRTIREVDDVFRGRALARARATVTTATVTTSAAAELPSPRRAMTARIRSRRVSLAATAALAIGAAAAAATLRSRGPEAPPPSSASSAPVVPPACVAACEPARSPSVVISESRAVAKPRRLEHPHNTQDSYAAEVDLLLRAQAAYAGGDLSGALVVVTEHGRRFSRGRLCEEREALRVRSLAGSGRTDEARHAAGAFAERFPRSVLLPNLRETVRVRD